MFGHQMNPKDKNIFGKQSKINVKNREKSPKGGGGVRAKNWKVQNSKKYFLLDEGGWIFKFSPNLSDINEYKRQEPAPHRA